MADTGTISSSGSASARERMRLASSNLAGLNSGRLSPVHVAQTIDSITSCAEIPFSQAYKVLTWVIENVSRRNPRNISGRELCQQFFWAAVSGAKLVFSTPLQSHTNRVRKHTRVEVPVDEDNPLFQFDDRAAAMQWLRDWLEDNLTDYLIICDPYFGPDDLEILRYIREVQPACQVTILTGLDYHAKKIPKPWEEAYQVRWRMMSAQSPPPTNVVIIGTGRNKAFPIHDRWMITKGAGISVGTSLSALGITRITEAKELSPTAAAGREAAIDDYVSRRITEVRGEPVHYHGFILERT